MREIRLQQVYTDKCSLAKFPDGAIFNWVSKVIQDCFGLLDEGLTLEKSAFLLFTVANLRFQLSC